MNAADVMDKIVKETSSSATAFATIIGVTRNKISDVICGRVKAISVDLAKAICVKFPQYNPLWVLTGEGEIYTGQSQTIEVTKNVVNGNGNATGGNGSRNNAGVSEEIVKALLDELAATRKQNEELIQILKGNLK